jgi:hypothetical protein
VTRRFKEILVEYGVVALVVHYVIFGAVLVGAYVAMRSGWQPTGRVASVGTWAAAYVVAKITQPVRIGVTLLVTPFVARLYERVTGRRPGGLPGLPKVAPGTGGGMPAAERREPTAEGRP